MGSHNTAIIRKYWLEMGATASLRTTKNWFKNETKKPSGDDMTTFRGVVQGEVFFVGLCS